jgi:hypothetical protein
MISRLLGYDASCQQKILIASFFVSKKSADTMRRGHSLRVVSFPLKATITDQPAE